MCVKREIVEFLIIYIVREFFHEYVRRSYQHRSLDTIRSRSNSHIFTYLFFPILKNIRFLSRNRYIS